MNLAEAAGGRPFDLVVVGGGINGAGIAREAAVRGLSVALFEADDFGFGATWRSTRLIHGGLRYLEHGEFGLVFESLRERGRLLRERPHLVKPQPFVLPGGRFSRRPGWQVRLGLAAYDLLALGGGLPQHSSLNSREMAEAMPGMGAAALGGYAFYDARAVSPERLTLELALEAQAHGALVANRAKVTNIATTRGLVAGVTVEHEGRSHEVAAYHVVNAAGPWVDAVNEAAGIEGPRIIGATRGSHLAIEIPDPLPGSAVLSTAQSDGRVFFAVPHSGLLLVGTTDVRDDGDPGCVSPTDAECEYLLAEARELFPAWDITRDRVRYACAGLRPLLAGGDGPEAAISRRHALINHGDAGGPKGLYSVAGGKLSTYRPLAHQLLQSIGVRPASSRAWPPRPLPGATGEAGRIVDHLERYGHAASGLLRSAGRVLCAHAGAVTAEVQHAVQQEQATTMSDVLMRRTGIAWHGCRGLCCHQEVARLMAPLLGWSQETEAAQVAQYERDVDRHLPAWGGSGG